MVIQALHLYLSPLRRCKLGLFPQPVEELGPWGLIRLRRTHNGVCSTCRVSQAGPDPFFELQRVLVEKGSGPACVPFWVERDFLWAASDPVPSPNLCFSTGC